MTGKSKHLTPLGYKKIKVRMDKLFPTSRHLSYTFRYRFHKEMSKAKPNKQGMGLMFPYRDDDNGYFHWFIKNINTETANKPYFRNRFVNVFALDMYKQIKGTKAEKFSQLTKLLTYMHGKKATHDSQQLRTRVKTWARIITLVGEGYYIWSEKDGSFYCKISQSRLKLIKTSLQHMFEYYVGKLDPKEQERLGRILAPSRKVEKPKVYSRPSRAGTKQRVPWNKGLTFVKGSSWAEELSFQKT